MQTISEELVGETQSAALKETNVVDEQNKTDCETFKVEDEVSEACEEIKGGVTDTNSTGDALLTHFDCCEDSRLTATDTSKKEIFETIEEKVNTVFFRITELEKQFNSFKKVFSLKFENGLKRLQETNEESLETINKFTNLLERIESKLAIDGFDSEKTENHKPGQLISYTFLSEFLDTCKKPSFKLSN